MNDSRRQLHLNAFLMSSGHHEAAWRLPESDPRADFDVAHWVRLARIAERGALDSLFLADGPSLWHGVDFRPGGQLEPTVLLSVLAAATTHIGLIATASTTYNEPYNLARRFASLDLVSGGRAGWNIVTTADQSAAQNFGLSARPNHAERYARAAEFVDVSLKLWDSWDDDAVIADKERGRFARADGIHPIEHEGEHYRVRGPLNVPRSPQGRPLLVQAGSSEDGKEFAARYADAVFTAQQTLDEARDFYVDLKQRAARVGRDPDKVKILPGIVPVLGGTVAEAEARAGQLDDLIVPAYGLRQLSDTLEVPVEILELDKPLPAEIRGGDNLEGAQSRASLIVELARREQLTVRQLIGRLGGGRGHWTFVGTPEQAADAMQLWFDRGAADGFNVMGPVLPSTLEQFVDQVVPILRRRGLFRTQYTGTTLREHYGLPRPASSHAVVEATAA
jgi:FMN-dependent oxidoreductase (nitrilotriacetate monooxygenase family)